MIFCNWDYMIKVVKKCMSRQEFKFCYYYIKKLNGTIQKYMLVCKHFEQPKTTKSKDKKKKTTFKYIRYTWQINRQNNP